MEQLDELAKVTQYLVFILFRRCHQLIYSAQMV